MDTDNSMNEKAVQDAISKAQQEAAEAGTEEMNQDGVDIDTTDASHESGEPSAGKDECDKAEDGAAAESGSRSDNKPGAEEIFTKRSEKAKKHKRDKRDEQIEDLTDKLKRTMAEFENFRKRTDREKSGMYEMGAGDVAGKILPVIDNFERGLSSVPEEQKQDPFIEGIDKIYKQLMTVMDGIGVKEIEAVGKEFDPEFHNAVMHVEDEDAGENIIIEEFQKGYMYHDTVLRHSMVKVAN